jgi:hypothetical protein
MTLKSAYDDLRQRTMEKIPGTWEKLKYVAGLRSSQGGVYKHWGFERHHGIGAAQSAFSEVHNTLVKTVLRTRLSTLREELEQSSEAEAVSPVSYASKLSVGLNRLLPADCPKEAQSHLFSVLETLSALAVHKDEDSQSS